MDVKSRIIYALEKSSVSRQALADKLGLGRGAVSAKLNGDAEFDSLKYVEATAELTGFRFEWLRTGQGPELEGEVLPNTVGEPALTYERKSKEALEKLVDTQALTIKLLEENIARLEQALQQQSKTGV
jgi:transcriptional regulator with XRE-family HTH domain